MKEKDTYQRHQSRRSLNRKNIRSVRPGFGMHPKYYNAVLGKVAKQDLEKGSRLSFDDLD